MSDTKKKLSGIDRRTFLKGAGNVMIALPFLDFMLDGSGTALAQTGAPLPKRYLIMFNGISIGRSDGSRFNPVATGAGWVPTTPLAPINNFPLLKPYVNVITNLSIPYSGNIFNDGPKFGPADDFHLGNRGCAYVQLRGVSAGEVGASSDQLLKSNLALGPEFLHMNYLVQPRDYINSGTSPTQFSSTGQAIAPVIDPAQAFASMVTGLKSDNTAAEAQRLFDLRQRKSVLDLLDKDRVAYLNKVISPEAKTALNNHFDRLRDLEKAVDADILMGQVATSTCKKSTAPVVPPIGSNYVGTPSAITITGDMGWSNETKRSELFRDIAIMGMSCDRSRLGTIRLTYDQSFVSAQQLIGVGKGSGRARDYHETTHGTGTLDDLALCTAWHTNEFFKLAEALRSIPEGAGNILDNTVMLFLSEGGWATTGPHSGDNMAIVTAGKAGGFKSGNHLKAAKQHPGDVIFSAMKAVGYTGASFNKVTREFPGLK